MAATTEEDKKKEFITDITLYSNCKNDIYHKISQQLRRIDRFQSIRGRKHESVFDVEVIKKVSKGKYATRWRGLSMMKDCMDMVVYQQLFWEVRPRTIFETGAYTGACALWMADTMKQYKLDAHVYSIDIDIGLVESLAMQDENVTIKQADATKISEAFSPQLLKECPHPWIITEDCHVDLLGVMEYFHEHMKEGDYFIIEDTSPDTPLMSGQGLLDVEYQKWGLRKLTLLKQFLNKYDDYYRVDSFYTDYYGYNSTFNWDGYIKRIK